MNDTGRKWRPSLTAEEKAKLEAPGGFTDFFDREGNPIGMGDWAEAMNDLEYKRVAEDTVGDTWISTVWLGLNHAFFADKEPLIFETMVFDQRPETLARLSAQMTEMGFRGSVSVGEDLYQARYSNEYDARRGHKEIVVAVEAGLINDKEESV